MLKNSIQIFIVVTVLLVSVIHAEIVQFEQCDEPDPSICEIKEVRVEPCKEAEKNLPCKFKLNTNVTMQMDYIPHFSAKRLLGQAYSANFLVDLPLIGMERDACKTTNCPSVKEQPSTYISTIFMSPIFPTASYTVKWRLWDPEHDTKGCCMLFKIKIVR